VLVLAQVKISAVLRIESYVPDIQERLRRQGYPKFGVTQIQQISMGQNAQPQVQNLKRWLFADKDQRWAASLAPDFVTLETSRYETFDHFLGRLETVLKIVGEVAEVALAERLGLRYVNAILPARSESLNEYLDPGLRGLAKTELGIEKSIYRFETKGTTPVGTLVVRLTQRDDGAYLPADLTTAGLRFDLSLDKANLVTVLDIDHFSTEQREFLPALLLNQIDQLHGFSESAFKAAVTQEALERWGLEEIADGNGR
jgi:uncharacterized protein (TIGR04255 family)